MADSPDGLDDGAVEQRLARLDEVLGHLEQIPGRTAELALTAVETLAEVYGEALRRVTTCAVGSPEVLDAMAGDELLRHLLMLHRIHPDPMEHRVAQAIEDVRAQLRSQGIEPELTGVEAGVADIRLAGAGRGCGSTAARELVREQVLAAAPELAEVRVVSAEPAPALIPVTALLRRPTEAAVGGVD
jgi:Fe-S cluster biogenesis protein NfuA